MKKFVPVKSFDVKLFVNGVKLTAGELEAIILRGLDKEGIIADVVSVVEVLQDEVYWETEQKPNMTHQELAMQLVREAEEYCKEDGIDTAFGLECGKIINKNHCLPELYKTMTVDEYSDWCSDKINDYFKSIK